jgi:uncharacterized membrane protein YcaP (DUF421 family)
MFFDNWFGLLRILIVGILAYIVLIVLLRVSGKRTLTQMNAFDFIVTVALGSTLATVLLSEQVALMEGIVAFVTLIALQFVISSLSVRSKWVESVVNSEPTLLFYQGDFLHETMLRERVTQEEIEATARQQGVASLNEVYAVVLETDGSFSVIEGRTQANATSLRSVHFPEAAKSRRNER